MSDSAEKDARPLLCRIGLHRFKGPGCEPFFSVFYEPFCLRGCGKPRVTPPEGTDRGEE